MSEIVADQRAIRQQLNSARIWSPSQRVDSCAVVGSSASLLSHHHGPGIDEHELVLRINTAPVAGFESHVGSRTDF